MYSCYRINFVGITSKRVLYVFCKYTQVISLDEKQYLLPKLDSVMFFPCTFIMP